MLAADPLGLARVLEPLPGILPDRLEHPEALGGVAEKALLHQRLEPVERGAGHRLGRFEPAPTSEDSQAREQDALAIFEEIV